VADLPVVANQSGGAFSSGSPVVPGSDFLKGVLGMPVVRQMTLLIALAASVVLALFAFMWMQTPDYRPMGGSLTPDAMNDAVAALDGRQIDYRIDQNTGLLLVKADQIYSARMALAGDEVLEGSQLGYELLDKEQSFGVSQFMEIARHRRSVEGELARSISTITSVQQARVLLATPKSTTFLRDRRKPSASVTVTLKAGRKLTSDQVRGITNLVAAAVPELASKDVVVVDQTGAFLSDGAEDGALRQSERDLSLVRSIEDDLHNKIANILTPWVGSGRFTAEVNAAIDFTRSEQTNELYNPDLIALRSEDRFEEQNVGTSTTVGGVPGTLTNQPPVLGEVAEATNSAEDQKKSSTVRSTRNYEVDRTISHTRHQVGKLQRLSVTVVVDDLVSIDAETSEPVSVAWSVEELEKLEQAVQTAIGFRADRGDTVSVVNRAFYREPQSIIEPTPFWAESWFSDVLKQVLGGIAIILVVFGLLRPMFKNLSQAGELVREQQSLAIADMTQMREAALQEAVPGLPTQISLNPDESSANRMETVRNLISEDPNRVAQVVKHWVSEDE
jgi:flagellar M-ring protein FliF